MRGHYDGGQWRRPSCADRSGAAGGSYLVSGDQFQELVVWVTKINDNILRGYFSLPIGTELCVWNTGAGVGDGGDSGGRETVEGKVSRVGL